MSGFVSSSNIFCGTSFDTREDLLRFVAKRAFDMGICEDAEAVYEAFLAREAIGETGMTDGFAVPHAKCSAIKESAVIVIKNTKAVIWPSFDGNPIDIALALLVPEKEVGTTHIKLLSKTAVLLMNEDFRAFARATQDPEELASSINASLEE